MDIPDSCKDLTRFRLSNFPSHLFLYLFYLRPSQPVDVFLGLSCFFHDPADVGNLISGSSAYSIINNYLTRNEVMMILTLHFSFGLVPSVQFRCSVMSDSLWPHGLQHARLPCPSPTTRAYSTSYPSHWWCHPTISSSVIPFSSRLQSFLITEQSPKSVELQKKEN